MAALEDDAARTGEQEGIWPENAEIVDAFLSVSTQWRAAALADGRLYFIGLDYAACRAGLKESGIATTPSLWQGLRTMEMEAKSALNGVRG